MKLDPYKHELRYFNWKSKIGNKLPEISDSSSKLILNYIFDMEKGLNVSSVNKKGSRGFPRLNNLRQRLIFLCKKFQEMYDLDDISKITEEQLFSFFNSMRNGEIKTLDGKTYKSVADYIKVFKSFWHWYQKVNKKNGNGIIDITEDLDTSSEKPKWVYLDEDQVKKLCNKAKPEYRVFIMFLFDTGMRAPSELINIKVSDFLDDYKELFIRDEISKTFGRRIKLLISSELVRDFVKENNLEQDDYLFKISPSVVNRYLRRLALKVFGEGVSLAGEKYSNLTMYDFGHVSCCYWLPRYKSESALKYRFDWKKSDKIHYYSELLGMKDTIQEEDLLIDVTKTEIEKRLISSERDNEVLKERVASMEGQMKEILGEVRNITNRLDR